MFTNQTIAVGIDQSLTSTGFFLFLCDDVKKSPVQYEYQVFETKKGEGELNKLERCVYIADSVVEKIDAWREGYPFTEVKISIEGLSNSSFGQATRDLAGLQFIILDTLVEAGYKDIEIVAPKRLKKFATGNGNASKQMMIEKLPQCFLDKFKQQKLTKKKHEDLADAYWLAMNSVNEVYGRFPDHGTN